MGTAVGAWAFEENVRSRSAEHRSGFIGSLPRIDTQSERQNGEINSPPQNPDRRSAGLPAEPTRMPALQEQTRGEKQSWRDERAATKANATGLKTGAYKTKSQRRSKMPAAPMPPPMHMVTMPYLALRRRSSRMSVAVSFAPV